jgi:type IV secretion system protein TrbL
VENAYHESSLKLPRPEVALIATSLIVIDATIAIPFWNWGTDGEVLARLLRRRFHQVFAYIIGR